VRIANHVRTRHHPVPSDPTEIFPATVNSYHELALTSCPPGFTVLATVEDGSIEAIAHEQLPWEGWMWHPERDQPVAEANTRRLLRIFGK
jgi:putative glutamine amidotransferase